MFAVYYNMLAGSYGDLKDKTIIQLIFYLFPARYHQLRDLGVEVPRLVDLRFPIST